MPMYRIHRFSKLTGLSTHVIRAWEKRYGLVEPVRGANRYRLYNDEDVRLFRYLKTQVDQGMSIGQLAELGRGPLLEQAQRELVLVPVDPPPSDRLVSDLIQALQAHDRAGFERRLNGALAVIPFEEALHRFLLPLQQQVGQLWHDGKLAIAQEHYASNQIKQKIFSATNQLRVAENGPVIVVACPAQEWHEISAMTAAYLCAARGCRIHSLGPNLPVQELARYCQPIQPSFVLLSLTVERSKAEVLALAQELAESVLPLAPVGIGGQCAQSHADILTSHGLQVLPDLKALDGLVYGLRPAGF